MSLSENFGTLTEADKLDRSNYALWSFMLRNILVGKGLWDIVSGDEVRRVTSPGTPSSQGSISSSSHPLTEEQRKFDCRNAQALSLISLSVKRHIMETIKSCTSSKDAWDKLSSMHNVKNMARVIALNNQVTNMKMNDGQTIT